MNLIKQKFLNILEKKKRFSRWNKIRNIFQFTIKLKDFATDKIKDREEEAKKLEEHDNMMRFEIGKFVEPFLLNLINNPKPTSENLLVI